MGYPARQLVGGLEMAERGQVGERLATMLQHAAESAENQTEVSLRNLNTQDETIKAQREAIEVQRRAAEAIAADGQAREGFDYSFAAPEPTDSCDSAPKEARAETRVLGQQSTRMDCPSRLDRTNTKRAMADRRDPSDLAVGDGQDRIN
jgi:hypothetical protein